MKTLSRQNSYPIEKRKAHTGPFLRQFLISIILAFLGITDTSSAEVFHVQDEGSLEYALTVMETNWQSDVILIAQGAALSDRPIRCERGYLVTIEGGWDSDFIHRAPRVAACSYASEPTSSGVGPIAPQQNTTGPTPPAGVSKALTTAMQWSFLASGGSSEMTVLGVPGYAWRHGCGPTAVGMVVGYYDGRGYDDLFPGSAASQTEEVNQGIASQRSSGDAAHYEDYSVPVDNYPDIVADKSEGPTGDEHSEDCIADFMKTSWSAKQNSYGWSWSSDVAASFMKYVSMRNCTYLPTVTDYYMYDGSLSWSALTNEISQNRPMVFLVDADSNGITDHFVAIVGFRDSPVQQYGCLDTWAPCDQIRWCDFAAMESGQPWGIWGGWSFHLKPPVLLTVSSAFGGASQGTLTTNWGADLSLRVTNSPVSYGDATQYVCRGWTGTGSVPETGTTTNTASFVITTNSSITWLWNTNFWLDVERTGSGSSSVGDFWVASGMNVQIAATPSNHWHFNQWTGQTAGCILASNTITIPMTGPRSVIADFIINQHKLTVITPYGQANPAAGTNWFNYGSSNSLNIKSPVILGGTQCVCRGWSGTGSVPTIGTTTNTDAFALTSDSSITWLWKTNYWLDTEVIGNGMVSVSDAWCGAGSNVIVRALVPMGYYVAWSGDTNGATVTGTNISVKMTQARAITATLGPLDFEVVDITLSPAMPHYGGTFTAYVTVTNGGAVSGNAGYLYVYTNKVAGAAAGTAGSASVFVGTLASGEGKTLLLVGLSAGGDGNKTFRAFVDALGVSTESNETNNQAILDYEVQKKPDLNVTSVMLDPSVPSTGCTFSVVMVLKNQGTLAASNFHVSVWADKATAPTDDTGEDSGLDVAVLGAGQSMTNVFTGLLAGDGTALQMLRVFADSQSVLYEADETNNQSTNRYLPMAHAEFEVTGVTLTPSTPLAGKTFSATVTVQNRGGAASDGGSVYVYTNKPEAVPAGTAGNGLAAVGILGVGSSKTFTLSNLSAGSAGAKTFRAFVDATGVAVEMYETNNQATLEYSVKTCTNLSISGSAALGEGVTSPYTCTAYYSDASSEDVTPYVTWSENSLYAAIASNGVLTTTNTLTANSSFTLTAAFGGYSASRTITLQNDLRPDFQVNLLSLSPGGTVPAGKTFTAYVTVGNQGAVPGDGGYLSVWTNQPTAVTNKTYGNKYVAIGTITNGQTRAFTLTGLTVPPTNGTFTFRACVDSQQTTAESEETNNQAILSYEVRVLTNLTISGPATVGEGTSTQYTCTAYYNDGSNENVAAYATWSESSLFATIGSGGLLRTTNTLTADSSFTLTAAFAGRTATHTVTIVNDLKPDFEVAGILLVPGGTVPAGKTFTAYVTVTNRGLASGDAGSLSVWTNSPVAPTNKVYGNKYLAGGVLAAGQAKTYTFAAMTAPWSNGVYELRACVDSQQATLESVEANNQTSLLYTCKVLTNLTVTGSALVGEGTGTQYVCTAYWSDGTSEEVSQWTTWTDNSLYAAIDSNGLLLTTNTLTANSSATVTASFGTRTVTRAVTVQNDLRPDFQIGGLAISPVSPLLSGGSFAAYVTVRNLGPVSGSGGYVDIWTNRASEVTNKVHGQAYQLVGTLGAGSNKVFTFSGLKAPSSNGVCTLRSLVDSQQATTESQETNNQGTLDYQVRSVTNLVVSGLQWVNENSVGAYGCTAYFSDGAVQDVTTSATWSDSSAYATVTSVGWLTTLSVPSEQACKLTATYGGRSTNMTVTILNR